MIKLGIISLGCDKNRVDTEKFLYNISGMGFEITEDFSSAEVVIINTCAFINAAREESIDTILDIARYKQSGKLKILAVTGCLPQKYLNELTAELPEVDLFLGVNEYDLLLPKIKSLLTEKGIAETECVVNAKKPDRILTTPSHYAYLKIADGCDNHCTYCTIPSIRGKYVSVPIERLVAEAQSLSEIGVKELILVAQDCTRYGRDLYGEDRLVDLIKALAETDIQMIRLMYCYPELVTDELIELIASEPKVAKYIDMPMQHIDDEVLRRMGRRDNYENLVKTFEKIKATGADIAVRTTFMVGFPGETKAQFKRLCEFTKKYKPDHVGIFAYSAEEDTPSMKLLGHVSEEEKARRVKKLGKIHYKNAVKANKKLIGQTIRVLYEDIDYERGMFRGRSERNAPEIDAYVYFKGEFADVGNYYDVYITKADGYDLIGVLK